MSDSPNPLDALRAALEKAQAAEMAFWASGSDATERVQDAAWSAVSTALAAAEAERTFMRAVLQGAQQQFAAYAYQHRAKHTPEADEKARVNDEWAEQCRRALNSEPSDAS